MADRLGDIAGDRLEVSCSTCRRRGRYRIAGLLARYGPEISTLDLLRALTASCRHQRAPGAPAERKYVSRCLAELRYAKSPSLEPPVPAGRPYTIEVWGRGGQIEVRLGVLYPLAAAIAAFEAAQTAYPADEVTLRQGAMVVRIVRRRERSGEFE